MTQLPGIELIGMLLLALLVDILVGGQRWLGRLHGPDAFFLNISKRLIVRLNREGRGSGALFIRGAVILLLLPLFAWIGGLLDAIGTKGVPGFIIALVTLALIIGQRLVFEMVTRLGQMFNDLARREDDQRYGAARWGIERLMLRMTDGLIASGTVFLLGGFTLLIPYRFLSMLMAAGSPSGCVGPQGPFFALPRALYLLFAIPLAFLASILYAFACLFVPHGSLRAFKGLVPQAGMLRTKSMASRSLPMAVTAFGLGLAFKCDPSASGKENWIGPDDGIARLQARSLRRVQLLAGTGGLLYLGLVIALYSLAGILTA